MRLGRDDDAWNDDAWWQTEDRKILERTNVLVKDIDRNGNEGLRKPEALEHGFQGYRSRRTTDEHRLVYKVSNDEIAERRLSLPLREVTPRQR